MNSTLSLNTTIKIAALALLLVATSLLFIPGQAAGLGHGSRLMQLADLEDSAGSISNIGSPDRLLASLATERASVLPVARIESPDMLIARQAVETSSPAAVETAVVGINIWAVLLILILSASLIWLLFSWQRLFAVREKDVERLISRCELVGQSC
jgi:hypothetical protein